MSSDKLIYVGLLQVQCDNYGIKILESALLRNLDHIPKVLKVSNPADNKKSLLFNKQKKYKIVWGLKLKCKLCEKCSPT